VEMEPVNTPHVNRVKDLYDRLQKLFADQVDIYAQSPIELPQDGRPQPDLTILKSGSARAHLPLPEDVLLLIEVSDSTLEKDRNAKLALYARDGISEYWIVNLQDNQLEVYRDPQRERYATSFTVQPGTKQACLTFPNDPIDWS
jgi:Uma2 family endonuclease